MDAQLLDGLVDVQQPGPEAAKHGLQLGARCLALQEVGLEAAGELFMERTPLLGRHRIPGGRILHAHPAQHRIQVLAEATFSASLASHVIQHFKIEVA